MNQSKIAISDCDHVDFNEELAVCRETAVELCTFQCKSEDELITQLQEFQAIGVQYAPFTRRVLSQLPNLTCLVRYGVGVDNIDVQAAADYGVSVSNIPDYGTQEVASHAFALMMALTRKLDKMNRLVHAGVWRYEEAIPLFRYRELTVGVVGIGRIGRAFAQMVRGLGCRVIAYDPAFPVGSTLGSVPFVELVALDELLKSSDVISLHSPLETSRSAISAAELRLMKPTAYLINVTRGGVVDENALEQALEEKWIAGAACDVFVTEPLPREHPLLRFENFLATPHMAWYSEQASHELCRKLAEELVRGLKGEPPRYCLNRRA